MMYNGFASGATLRQYRKHMSDYPGGINGSMQH